LQRAKWGENEEAMGRCRRLNRIEWNTTIDGDEYIYINMWAADCIKTIYVLFSGIAWVGLECPCFSFPLACHLIVSCFFFTALVNFYLKFILNDSFFCSIY
jgi:hypothetical protein